METKLLSRLAFEFAKMEKIARAQSRWRTHLVEFMRQTSYQIFRLNDQTFRDLIVISLVFSDGANYVICRRRNASYMNKLPKLMGKGIHMFHFFFFCER